MDKINVPVSTSNMRNEQRVHCKKEHNNNLMCKDVAVSQTNMKISNKTGGSWAEGDDEWRNVRKYNKGQKTHATSWLHTTQTVRPEWHWSSHNKDNEPSKLTRLKHSTTLLNGYCSYTQKTVRINISKQVWRQTRYLWQLVVTIDGVEFQPTPTIPKTKIHQRSRTYLHINT